MKNFNPFLFFSLDIGSLVLLCFDESTYHYVALTLTTDKYFLHPESLKEIQKGMTKTITVHQSSNFVRIT